MPNPVKVRGEDSEDLEGIFDDVPLDNSDIQQVAEDTQLSPIPDTPPNTITVDVDVHTPVVSLNIFHLDVKLFPTEHAIFQPRNYNISLGSQRTSRCFNKPWQILKLPTTSESSSTESEDVPQDSGHMTKSTITTQSDTNIAALAAAQEEAELPPPPPQQQSPSPLPPPEKPEKKPQSTGWMTRLAIYPLQRLLL